MRFESNNPIEQRKTWPAHNLVLLLPIHRLDHDKDLLCLPFEPLTQGLITLTKLIVMESIPELSQLLGRHVLTSILDSTGTDIQGP